MSKEKATVVLVDDHPIVRLGWHHVIDKSPDFRVQAVAATLKEGMVAIDDNAPDILVCDITLGRDNGLELVEEVHRKYPQTEILVVSMHPETKFAVRAFQAGAIGYLQKDAPNGDLLKALRDLASGGAHLSKTIQSTAVSLLREAGKRGWDVKSEMGRAV